MPDNHREPARSRASGNASGDPATTAAAEPTVPALPSNEPAEKRPTGWSPTSWRTRSDK